MTEAEAKTKWCPMSRVRLIGPDDGARNFGEASRCIASACMAWRWSSEYEEAVTEGEVVGGIAVRVLPPPGEGWQRTEPYTFSTGPGSQNGWRRRKHERGYCGAFGSPE